MCYSDTQRKRHTHLISFLFLKQISNEALTEQPRFNKKANPELGRTSISSKMTTSIDSYKKKFH